jgi:chromosome segregation ATPase
METANVSAEAFAAEAGTVPVVAQSSDNAVVVDAPTTKATSRQFYTEEDLAKVRSQEKEKLYPQIDKLKEELEDLKRQREEEARMKAEQAAQEEAARKAAAEDDLDVRSLLKTKETEWQEQLERERQERERAFALLEREKAFADLQNYRAQRLDQERESIIPELVDLVTGNTQEEVEASINGLKERSARILESAQSAMQNARKEMTGTRVTAPSAGPLETNSENRQFTAEDISSMSMNDYAKYRERIMSDAARGKSRGLFGN